MADLQDLLAQAQRPELRVSLCLRGDLFAERNRVAEQLATHRSDTLDDTVGVELAARLTMLNDTMRDSTHEFVFVALPRNEFRTLRDSYTIVSGEPLDREFLDALIAASLRTPDLSGDDVKQLLEALSEGQAAVLEDAAWSVNQDTDTIPF